MNNNLISSIFKCIFQSNFVCDEIFLFNLSAKNLPMDRFLECSYSNQGQSAVLVNVECLVECTLTKYNFHAPFEAKHWNFELMKVSSRFQPITVKMVVQK